VDRATALRLWEQVKANRERLDACAGPHEFADITGRQILNRYGCTKCGGQVDHIARAWYERGLAHGRKASG